ncbi:hypothetical protein DL98DRAFT_632873 [Cadophora sp. DSE1049]|nr:hypothetical protein DL98DRAFT_632873 [Cadophora sp. DSE1049]
MRFSSVFVLGVQISSIVALPAHSVKRSQVDTISYPVLSRNVEGSSIEAQVKRNKEAKEGVAAVGKAEAGKEQAVAEPAKVEAGKAAEGEAAAGKAAEGEAAEGEAAAGEAAEGEAAAGEAAAGGEAAADEGEEEKLAGEKELVGAFGTAVALEGGDIKQDTLFTKSAIGAFEFEFQSQAADELTVTENKTPAAPPAGFVAIEPSSFQVALGVSKGAGLTLSKIDYVFDGTNTALAAMDLTQAKVGKLCADTGSFVIEETLGELEFEAEENEVTLNLNKAVTAEGEWGIFLPAAAAGAAAEGEAAAGGAKNETAPGEAAAGGAKNETAVAEPAAKPAAGEAAGGNADLATNLQDLIDQLRSGRASVPGFVAVARR